MGCAHPPRSATDQSNFSSPRVPCRVTLPEGPAAARTCSNSYSEVSVVAPLLTACSGFLLAVLWMDLIFDVQVLRNIGVRTARTRARLHRRLLPQGDHHLAADEPADRRRHADPVGRVGFQAARGHDPGWLLVTSAILAAVPMLLALTHTVPVRGPPRTAHRQSARTVAPGAVHLSGSPRLRRQHAGVPGAVGCTQRGDLRVLVGSRRTCLATPTGARTKLEHVSIRFAVGPAFQE